MKTFRRGACRLYVVTLASRNLILLAPSEPVDQPWPHGKTDGVGHEEYWPLATNLSARPCWNSRADMYPVQLGARKETFMRNNEHLYSPKELAEMLGVPLGSLYRWNYLGTGPLPLRVGRHIRFRTTDVDAWLEARADEARARR